MYVSLIVGIGLGLGLLIGYIVGRYHGYSINATSGHLPFMSSIIQQLSVVKEQLDHLEQIRKTTDEQREERLKQFMHTNTLLFKQLEQATQQSDQAKEQRIQHIMNSTKELLAHHEKTTMRFLEQQGKTTQSLEQQRDAQLQDIRQLIDRFTSSITGTKRRGIAGEMLLADVLHHCLRAGVVIQNLAVGSRSVEFAWDLGDGKYIPIDSKFPDISQTIKQLEHADADKRAAIRKTLVDRMRKHIGEVSKYRNHPNTADTCILVVAPAITQLCPESIYEGKQQGVYVCSYSEVFPVAHLIEQRHHQMHQGGDLARYRSLASSLIQALESIGRKTEVIERAVVTITNANTSIKDTVSHARRL